MRKEKETAMKSLFNPRKPRQFTHNPIYWNPQKEERNEREQRISSQLGLTENDNFPKNNIKGTFVKSSIHLRRKKNSGNIRRIFFNGTYLSILIALLAILFFLLIRKGIL